MIIYYLPLVNNQQLTGNIQPRIQISGKDVLTHSLSLDDVTSQLGVAPAWHLQRYGFNLPLSDIENYQLHYNAWQAFSKEQDDWCLIVDASVKMESNATVIEDDIQLLNKDWDIFFPFDRLALHHAESRSINDNVAAMINPNLQEDHDPLPHLLGFSWGNSIYFLSKKGCRKLLAGTHIKQRVDDEIIQLSTKGAVNVFYTDVTWFSYTQQPVVKSIDRNKAIYNAITQRSRWTDQSKDMIRLLLRIISELAGKLEIDLLLQGGTHLGYIRHGGIMPWDDDVDLGIEEKDLAAFLTAIENYPGLAQEVIIEERTGIPFYKVWLKEGEPIAGHFYTFPFVDIWPFTKVGDDLLFRNKVLSPHSARYPYESVIFENAHFKIVGNSIEVLDARYRTWKKGIRVYNYHHSLERSEGFPLRVEITVDKNGRIKAFS